MLLFCKTVMTRGPDPFKWVVCVPYKLHKKADAVRFESDPIHLELVAVLRITCQIIVSSAALKSVKIAFKTIVLSTLVSIIC